MSKKQYFHNCFNNNLTNMKKTWEGINNILNRKSKKLITVKAMKDPNNKNNVSKDPSTIADTLKYHIASV